jgi:hypothetical protein
MRNYLLILQLLFITNFVLWGVALNLGNPLVNIKLLSSIAYNDSTPYPTPLIAHTL